MAYDQPVKQTINNIDVVPTISAAPQANVSGTITTATSVITATDLNGIGSATVIIYGTYAGVNITFEVLTDTPSAIWVPIQAQNVSTGAVTNAGVTGAIASNSSIAYNIAPLLGASQVRVRANAYTSGTANVIIHLSTQFVALPQGTQNTTSTSISPGVAATSLGKAEDAAHTTGDTGVAMWSVRNDNAATVPASANGDYQQISTDSQGTVFTRDSPSNTPSNAQITPATTSTTIRAANAARRSLVLYNGGTSDVYIAYGATASSTVFTFLLPSLGTTTITGQEYAGIVTGIWTATGGNSMQVTETSI